MKHTNLEIEQMLVSCLLVAPKLWRDVNFVHPEDFSDASYGEIYEEIQRAIQSGEVPNPTTVSEKLYPDNKEFRGFVGEIATSCLIPSSAHGYAKIIKELSTKRKLCQTASMIIEDCDTDLTSGEVAGNGISMLHDSNTDFTEFENAGDISDDILEDLDKPVECTPTGFKRLDTAMAGGFHKGRFYGFSARMKAGKSLLMSTMAYNICLAGGSRIVYLCLEMGHKESFQRVMSMQMGVNSLDFLDPLKRKGPEFKRKVGEAGKFFKNQNNLIYRSRPRMTFDDLKNTIAKIGMSGKYDGVFVDYLQLVSGCGHGKSLAQHYDDVSQSLAESVKRYPIWIASAAQLNRDGAVRGSDGMLMACDMSFNINKLDGGYYANGDRIPDRAWLEMTSSRYTQFTDIGSEDAPAYEIDYQNGPSFLEQ